MTTRALPVTASSSDAVARSDVGQDDAGEVVGVLVGRVDGARPAPAGVPTAPSAPSDAAMAATVVPHEPAPITATLSSIGPTLRPGAGDGTAPVHWPRDRSAGAPAPPDGLRGARPREGLRRRQGASRPHPRRRRARRPGPRSWPARVLAAAAPLPVAVVCDDAEVARWAGAHGAHGAARTRTRASTGRWRPASTGSAPPGPPRCSWCTPTCPSPTTWPSWPGSAA